VHSWLSFQDCIELHKLTVFPAEVAEKQRFYMQQTIKKPQQVTVHQYMSCMGVSNNYLAYLPMVYDSLMAVEDTKKSMCRSMRLSSWSCPELGTSHSGEPVQRDTSHAPQVAKSPSTGP
jgi:hypothetical protein